ncbi:MAG: glutamate racemase [Bacteroidota bacterium]
MADARPIGIFDSGLGGLSLVRALLNLLPRENVLYIGDTAHLPYGNKSLAEVQQFSLDITHFLLEQRAKAIAVACNTATAAAVNLLRKTWPEIPIVGMEPAVKPAAQATQSGVVGVLATQATFRSPRYADLTERYGKEVTVLEDPCRGLVELIEQGRANAPETEARLREILRPMQEAGADTYVLGCTHYPFAEPTIRRITGPNVCIINPAPAVARQLEHRLRTLDRLNGLGPGGRHRFLTTGSASAMQALVRSHLHLSATVEEIALST